MINNKKMFALNEDGVTEWIVARSKYEALSYATLIWGIDCVLEYYDEYLELVQDANRENFIEDFVREVPVDDEFTHNEYGDNYDKVVTKTIKEFLDDIDIVPSYFAHEGY